MQLKINSELQNGKYRIVKVLGQGGFGITYLAEHTMLDKLVAIKEFFPKEYCDRRADTSNVIVGTKNSIEIVEVLKAKFIKEARNISKLKHPNIVTIHDIFKENETAYYVMEYIEGASLAEIIKNNGPIPECEAVNYIRKIAFAIGYMHSLNMNHLDIKPANIMMRKLDNEPILIDFGLSKQYDTSGGQTSTTPIGISHGYAPIEQYRPGGVATFTPQTDVYALGATLYAMITAQTPPHYSDILENGIPEYTCHISESVKVAIEQSLEITKSKRPATVEKFIALFDTQGAVIEKPTTDVGNMIDTSIDLSTGIQAEIPIELVEDVDDSTKLINKSPEIQIKKCRGLNPRTRRELMQISWSVSNATQVFFYLNGVFVEAPKTGYHILTKHGDKFQLCAMSSNGSIIESNLIEF